MLARRRGKNWLLAQTPNRKIVGDRGLEGANKTIWALSQPEKSSPTHSDPDLRPRILDHERLGDLQGRRRPLVSGRLCTQSDRTIVTETFPHPLAGAALVSAAVNAPRTYGARVSLSF
jgi:hypothetical protein